MSLQLAVAITYAVTSTSLDIDLRAFFFLPPALTLHLAPKHGGQDWFGGVSWCGLPPGPHSLLQVRNCPHWHSHSNSVLCSSHKLIIVFCTDNTAVVATIASRTVWDLTLAHLCHCLFFYISKVVFWDLGHPRPGSGECCCWCCIHEWSSWFLFGCTSCQLYPIHALLLILRRTASLTQKYAGHQHLGWHSSRTLSKILHNHQHRHTTLESDSTSNSVWQSVWQLCLLVRTLDVFVCLSLTYHKEAFSIQPYAVSCEQSTKLCCPTQLSYILKSLHHTTKLLSHHQFPLTPAVLDLLYKSWSQSPVSYDACVPALGCP